MKLLWTLFIVLIQCGSGFYLKIPTGFKCMRMKTKLQLAEVFGGVNFASPIGESLHKLGISSPSPIQQASLVPLNSGVSSILHAHTGSGKTMAYLLPLLKRIYDTKKVPLMSLIVVPTRELAVQVAADVVSLCGDSSMVHICLGGVVEDITAPIVIGTPFRLLDILKGGCMNRTFVNKAMMDLEYLVIDEVDRLIPVPGRYVRAEERTNLLQRSNPSIELIRFIVKHKEFQLLNINRLLLSYQWEKQLPLQVVAASATVGRTMLRELNKLFYSYQRIPITREGQEPELVPPGSRGGLTVIRPEDAVSKEALRKAVNAQDDLKSSTVRSGRKGEEVNEDGEGLVEEEAKISRSIGVPSSISHIALLKPPVEPGDHAALHIDPNHLDIRHLELLRDFWVGQKKSLKRGLLFVPTVKDVPFAVQMFRKWRVTEAIDLQQALGLSPRNRYRHEVNGNDDDDSEDGGEENAAIGTKELISRANRRGIGGGTGREGVRELFIAPESAARGLHLQDLDCVMIFKLPSTMDQYLHMAGRTGRLSSLRNSQDKISTKERDRVVTIVDEYEYRRLTAWQTPLGIKLQPIGAENAKLHMSRAVGGRE